MRRNIVCRFLSFYAVTYWQACAISLCLKSKQLLKIIMLPAGLQAWLLLVVCCCCCYRCRLLLSLKFDANMKPSRRQKPKINRCVNDARAEGRLGFMASLTSVCSRRIASCTCIVILCQLRTCTCTCTVARDLIFVMILLGPVW